MQRIRRVIDNHNKLVRACHKEVVLIQDLKLKPSKIVKKIRNKRKPCKKIGDGYNSMFWAWLQDRINFTKDELGG